MRNLLQKQIMDKALIRKQLSEQHQEFMAYLKALGDQALHQQKNDKWSAIQNLDHLLKSIQIVNPAVRKPSFLLRRMFGKPNREARSYDALVQRYQERLKEADASPPSEFKAAESRDLDPAKIFTAYDKEVHKFLKFIDGVKDRKLDRTLLPHPLLGKLLMREILYFMHYHTEHHFKAIKISAS